MSNATNARALGIGAACLLAVLALLAARAPWASAGAPDPDGAGSAADAASCGPSPHESLDSAMDRAMENIRAAGRSGTQAETGFVVLNNRGYNYGPPPGVQLDAHLFEREAAGSALP